MEFLILSVGVSFQSWWPIRHLFSILQLWSTSRLFCLQWSFYCCSAPRVPSRAIGVWQGSYAGTTQPFPQSRLPLQTLSTFQQATSLQVGGLLKGQSRVRVGSKWGGILWFAAFWIALDKTSSPNDRQRLNNRLFKKGTRNLLEIKGIVLFFSCSLLWCFKKKLEKR